MEEKWMVNDILLNYNELINKYTQIINCLEEVKTREILIKIRNELEEFQIQFLILLKAKLYY